MLEHVVERCQCEGKACKQCEKLKCLLAFSPDKRGKQGRFARCKVCRNGSLKDRYYADLANKRAYNLANYHLHKEKRKQTRQANKEQLSQRRKTRYQQQRESVLASQKAYRQTNPEKVRQSRRAEYQRHAGAYYARARNYRTTHPEQAYQSTQNYRKRNPERTVAWKQNYRARITHNGGQFTPEEWQSLKALYNHTCLCCGRKEPEIKLCADHVIPLAQGGTSHINNIQPLCRSCNSKKHSKIIDYRPKGDERHGRMPGLFPETDTGVRQVS